MSVHMPDDKTVKYEADWTKLRVQNQSWESDEWGRRSEAITITTTTVSTNIIFDSISSPFHQ